MWRLLVTVLPSRKKQKEKRIACPVPLVVVHATVQELLVHLLGLLFLPFDEPSVLSIDQEFAILPHMKVMEVLRDNDEVFLSFPRNAVSSSRKRRKQNNPSLGLVGGTHELDLEQNTREWFELRKTCFATASTFGDICGFGIGSVLDFLQYMRLPSTDEPLLETFATMQGHKAEPLLLMVYGLYIGQSVQRGGFFWSDSDCLPGKLGASPDGRVVLPLSQQHHPWCPMGEEMLVEIKAPVYEVYDKGKFPPFGVKSAHMAQMQGQMAISGRRVCDYVAACLHTGHVTAVRVRFSPVFWGWMVDQMKRFAALWRLESVQDMQSTPPPWHTIEQKPLEEIYGRPFVLPDGVKEHVLQSMGEEIKEEEEEVGDEDLVAMMEVVERRTKKKKDRGCVVM